MSNATEQQAAAPVKKENKVVRFFVTLIWLIGSIGVDIYAIVTDGYFVGMIAEAAFFLLTFLIPYLRKKGSYTRYLGWLAFATAAWFAYCHFTGE